MAQAIKESVERKQRAASPATSALPALQVKSVAVTSLRPSADLHEDKEHKLVRKFGDRFAYIVAVDEQEREREAAEKLERQRAAEEEERRERERLEAAAASLGGKRLAALGVGVAFKPVVQATRLQDAPAESQADVMSLLAKSHVAEMESLAAGRRARRGPSKR
jgi:hypothetical protein